MKFDELFSMRDEDAQLAHRLQQAEDDFEKARNANQPWHALIAMRQESRAIRDWMRAAHLKFVVFAGRMIGFHDDDPGSMGQMRIDLAEDIAEVAAQVDALKSLRRLAISALITVVCLVVAGWILAHVPSVPPVTNVVNP